MMHQRYFHLLPRYSRFSPIVGVVIWLYYSISYKVFYNHYSHFSQIKGLSKQNCSWPTVNIISGGKRPVERKVGVIEAGGSN